MASFLVVFTLLFSSWQPAATGAPGTTFIVSMPNPATHRFHVEMQTVVAGETADFKLPAWTPGFYLLLNFAENVENFSVHDAGGRPLAWQKTDGNTWRVATQRGGSVTLTYDVKTTRPFVATCYLDEERGYIMPAGLLMHEAKKLHQPAVLTIVPFGKWKSVLTALDSVTGKKFTYSAPDFDVLYDSPILIGNLESLPSFTVHGVPHYFGGYRLGTFDRPGLIFDLQKIVTAAVDMMGDIPYTHYTFIAIGPGGGGIEHLNSTSFAFDGASLNTQEGRIKMLSFLAHEYFHHFNVKRIRPMELGPFDYDHENRTSQLWISEGLSVYYEYLLLRRAGIISQRELLDLLRKNMMAFENKSGRHVQSLAQSSLETWSDNPFARPEDEDSRKISYYDKGPVVGMFLDFAIRHQTDNKKSLDDVMRTLYKEYYQRLARGFTETEFRAVCAQVAGTSLPEIDAYVDGVRELNYPKYLGYGGFAVDTASHPWPGGYAGISLRQRGDSLFVAGVDPGSPAMKAGVTRGDVLLDVGGVRLTAASFTSALEASKPGDVIALTLLQHHHSSRKEIQLSAKTWRSFAIEPLPHSDALQQRILNSW
jgi:predicted metalloprotease with PDZ domain